MNKAMAQRGTELAAMRYRYWELDRSHELGASRRRGCLSPHRQGSRYGVKRGVGGASSCCTKRPGGCEWGRLEI